MSTAEAVDWAAVRAQLEQAQTALDLALDGSLAHNEALLQERTRLLAERRVVAARIAPADRALIVQLADTGYGLWLERLAGVAPMAACAPAPRGPAALLGLMTVRGGVWTVFDLARLLGADGQPSSGGHVVLLRHAARRIGLRVDRADTLRQQARGGIRAMPGGSALIAGVGPDGQIFIDIDAVWAHPAITEAR